MVVKATDVSLRTGSMNAVTVDNAEVEVDGFSVVDKDFLVADVGFGS